MWWVERLGRYGRPDVGGAVVYAAGCADSDGYAVGVVGREGRGAGVNDERVCVGVRGVEIAVGGDGGGSASVGSRRGGAWVGWDCA